MPRRENDPFAGFNFLVESGGLLRAGFSECTGLSSETDHIDYREGPEDITVRKLPGLRKQGNVTFKRGVAMGQDFFTWRKSVLDGSIDRRDISIILDRKSTRLNSSHSQISYAVFCLKKKKTRLER